MMEPAPRVPPHVALLNEIAKRRTSLAVQASGLAPVLEMLNAYITATESRLSELEQTRQRHEAILNQLTGMGGAVDQFKATMEKG